MDVKRLFKLRETLNRHPLNRAAQAILEKDKKTVQPGSLGVASLVAEALEQFPELYRRYRGIDALDRDGIDCLVSDLNQNPKGAMAALEDVDPQELSQMDLESAGTYLLDTLSSLVTDPSE